MAFKINLSNKDGKTYKIESDNELFVGKKLHETLEGKDISADLIGYELEITGASDKAGFPYVEGEEGVTIRKALLSFEKGMKKRPKREGKRKRSKNKPKGLRLRKTIRGDTLSEDTVQINLKVLKEGSKKLQEIFSDQAQGKAKANRASKRKEKANAPKEAPVEQTVEAPAQ